MTTNKVTPLTQREITKTDGKGQKSDRFAKLLAEKREKSDMTAPNSAVAASGGQQSQNVTYEPEPVAAGAAPRHIEHLANEIVSHMTAQASEAGHTVEIQFNAKTLDGLRVHLQSQQGAISVNLQTDVPYVARLLTNNLSSLRGVLERKGATVANLIVDRPHE